MQLVGIFSGGSINCLVADCINCQVVNCLLQAANIDLWQELKLLKICCNYYLKLYPPLPLLNHLQQQSVHHILIHTL